MPDRYTAHDYDAGWHVWDNAELRSVGGSFTEAGALAEAARLNAKAPQRAKAAEAWAVINADGSINPWSLYVLKPHVAAPKRLARVRITEIEGGDSHG